MPTKRPPIPIIEPKPTTTANSGATAPRRPKIPKDQNTEVKIEVRIQPDLRDRLKTLAHTNNLSMNSLIVMMLQEGIENITITPPQVQRKKATDEVQPRDHSE